MMSAEMLTSSQNTNDRNTQSSNTNHSDATTLNRSSYIMESNKKQGHGYFDSEMPADVRASKDSKFIYGNSLSKCD